MVYSFARVSAVVGMRRQEDYFLQGTRGWLRLHEKGGKRHDVPAHHRAEAAVDAYLVAGAARFDVACTAPGQVAVPEHLPWGRVFLGYLRVVRLVGRGSRTART